MAIDWTPIEPFEAKLNLEDAKFIFGQAEKKLKDTVDESQIIVARTTTIASVSFSITIALITYYFSKVSDPSTPHNLLFILFLSTTYFIIINILIIINLHPQKYKIVGTSPLQLYNKYYYDGSFDNTASDPTKRLLEFHLASIRGYQKSIDHNETINKTRWRVLWVVLWMIGMSPIVLSLFFWINTL